MKKHTITLLSLALFTLFLSHAHSQVTFVNGAATGNNDGSDWSNAFTTLDAALDQLNGMVITSPQEIWVAAGTYTPNGAGMDNNSTFSVEVPVDLYGGFDGSESNRDERDASNNIVTLSGDILDNDNSGMDSLARTDNVLHVMTVSAGIPQRIIMDGFTISGGQTLDDGDAILFERAGGGIFAGSAMAISNCTFTNNFGRSGGGIAFDGESIDDTVIVTDCTFENNMATSQSAGVIFIEVEDLEVRNCAFTNNNTARGCLYPLDCTNILVEDCLFDSNINDGGTGGGMFLWQPVNTQIINTTFSNNSANSGGAVYFDTHELMEQGLEMSLLVQDCSFMDNVAAGLCGGFRIFQGTNMVFENNEFMRNVGESAGGLFYSGTISPVDLNSLRISNCTFTTNQTTDGRGGGLRTIGGSFLLENSNFLGNVAAGGNSGGAISATGENKVVEIDNCLFGTNAANWGASIAMFDDNTESVIKNCSFLSNMADSRSGGVYAGFKASVTIDSCEFRSNTAGSGGAISSQNDSTTIIVRNSFFTRNEASNNGGAISTNEATNIDIFNARFTENQGTFGGAVAFNASNSPRLDTSGFLMRNSSFIDNTATEQGGAININDVSGRIENCIINNNTAQGPGRGGAISHNTADSLELITQLDLVNNTLANNLGLFSSGIAAFTAEAGQGIINSQNNLFFNLKDFEIEEGNPQFISLGGNFSRDVAGMEALLMSDDILGGDPMFVDQASMDYQLLAGSPLIDAGIADGAPERDFRGFFRIGDPDIGAYEFTLSTSVGNIETVSFNVWPNPTSDYINLDIDPQEKVDNIYFYNTAGQVVKIDQSDTNKIPVNELDNGLYYILVQGDKRYTASFVKE
jgi:predicted outer membrane repeat protein